jgi:Spermine/spermidine synthase domain
MAQLDREPAAYVPDIRSQQYAGMFLLSFATLLLELTLTRVLSVANWNHFAFLVISTALLGFGSSGVTLSLWTKLRDVAPLDHALASLSLLFGFVSLGSFWLMQQIPFQPFRLLVDHRQFFYIPLYYLVLAAPFFCSGLAISLLLSRGGQAVNRLYAADLLGAGLGCVAVCGVMPAFGGSGSVAVSGMFGMLAALAFKSFRPSKLTAFGAVAAAGMLALAFVAQQALPIRVIPEKLHPLKPVGRSPIYTEWNSFSRIDVYDLPVAPKEGRPAPGFLSIIIDGGAAGTGMGDLSVGVRNFLAHAPEYRPAGLAYVGKEHPKVLIIGSGAGKEVLEALDFGASSITAVEINPIITDIVTKRMREHWGGLFEQPEVRLVTEDGRSFLRRSKEKYDIIMSIDTVSNAALASGALSLSETYILTLEAFEDYWNHLTPDGILLVTRFYEQLPKLVATTRELFDRQGLGSPARHLVAFRDVTEPFRHVPALNGILLQKSPIRPEQVDLMAARLGIGLNKDWGQIGPPKIYYSPFRPPRDEFETLLADLAKSPDVERIYTSSGDLLRPATDDQPFFNQRMRWSSLWPGFRAVLRGAQRGTAGPVVEVILVVLLIQAIVIAGVMILLPLVRFGQQGLLASGRWAFVMYFAGLGLGFILIEIVLLQRFTLFLGEPIYTFSVVLAGLLIFTGAGSYLSNRIQKVSRNMLSWLLLTVVIAILFTLLITPSVLSLTLGLPLRLRVTVALLLIAPLGALLGVPFPTGLRLIGKEASSLVSWAWAVNAFFTVIGSVLAPILAMAFGFAAVHIIAASCYTLALLAIRTTPQKMSAHLLCSDASEECAGAK